MDWMGSLPSWMQTNPLSRLAIPGSHDSGSFSLDPHGPFANDQSKALAQILAMFPCIARPIVYRWSVTQALDYDEQLTSGIRYFDLRISSGPEPYQYSVVHGLYGLDIIECLRSVKMFSAAHPSEIIILDFNHFYGMQNTDHSALIHIVIRELGQLLVPSQNSFELVSLAGLWKTKGRVICIYQQSLAHFFPHFVWCSGMISSPWPNTPDKATLIKILNESYALGPAPPRILFATQGIVTPTTGNVLKRPLATLRDDMALGATDTVIKWIKTLATDNWFNIVLVDFTEFENFAQQIIDLNYSKLTPDIRSLPGLFESSYVKQTSPWPKTTDSHGSTKNSNQLLIDFVHDEKQTDEKDEKSLLYCSLATDVHSISNGPICSG